MQHQLPNTLPAQPPHVQHPPLSNTLPMQLMDVLQQLQMVPRSGEMIPGLRILTPPLGAGPQPPFANGSSNAFEGHPLRSMSSMSLDSASATNAAPPLENGSENEKATIDIDDRDNVDQVARRMLERKRLASTRKDDAGDDGDDDEDSSDDDDDEEERPRKRTAMKKASKKSTQAKPKGRPTQANRKKFKASKGKGQGEAKTWLNRPSWSVERSRKQVLARTGQKGAGSSMAFKFVDYKGEPGATKAGKEWVKKQVELWKQFNR